MISTAVQSANPPAIPATSTKATTSRVVIELEPLDGTLSTARIKIALKYLLRTHRMKCIRIEMPNTTPAPLIAPVRAFKQIGGAA